MLADDGLGVAVGDLFDVHATLGGEEYERLLGRAVHHDREVHLALDVRAALNEHLVDGVPADVHAEDLLCGLLCVLRAVDDLDASGLAAPADEHLRFYGDRTADLAGRFLRLLRRGRDDAF